MIDAKIDAVLRKVGRGVAGYIDETILRGYIVELHNRLADAEDRARRAQAQVHEDERPKCEKCGNPNINITMTFNGPEPDAQLTSMQGYCPACHAEWVVTSIADAIRLSH